jgi:hypothetical protein
MRLHSILHHKAGKLCLAFCSQEERIPTNSGFFRDKAKNALMRRRVSRARNLWHPPLDYLYYSRPLM